jgi:hypothetical protein
MAMPEVPETIFMDGLNELLNQTSILLNRYEGIANPSDIQIYDYLISCKIYYWRSKSIDHDILVEQQMVELGCKR